MSPVTRRPRHPASRSASGLDKGPVLRLPRPRSGVDWIDLPPAIEPADTSRRRVRALLTFAYAIVVVVLLVAMLDGRLG